MVGCRRTLSCCSLAALLISPLTQARDASQWLQGMVDAVGQQSYSGAFVYERSGSFSTHHIWHRADDDGITERLLRADGEPQEWVRRDGQVQCASSFAAVSGWHGDAPATLNPGRLERWYALDVLGKTRVANRPVTVVAMKPRDSFRYAYELYLDDQTGMLLKSLLINERNVLLERFQFTDVHFGELDDDQLEAGPGCLAVAEPQPEKLVDTSGWEPGWLPPGFTAGAPIVRALASNESPVMSQAYSDGLARFTLFVEPLGEGALAEDLLAQLGPTVAVSRRLQIDGTGYLATIVGEIPPATAERIAASFPHSAGEIAQ
ncbi:sigma factor AlgU regulatory protein MucB [Halopseudomonas oceani]|nr:MucB/RseB C-terminal domain-containing protein [Halopseudomonas oceani]GGE40724.1 sigma factor AlgU regulatory protein MucB [Halopseudomonas oceani]